MAFVFDLKVVPSSGRNKWMLDKSGRLKCYLKNPPEKGLANKELIKILAKALSLTQSDVEIIAGATSRSKKIRVSLDIDFDKLLNLLGVEKQKSIF